MGSQVDLTILVIWDLILPAKGRLRYSFPPYMWRSEESKKNLPFVEANIVLDKEQYFIRKIRRPQRSREVDIFKKHSAQPCTGE
jgi:hypothetical protein